MESPSPIEAELESRLRQQEAVAELGQRALEPADIDGLIDDAAAAVTDALGAEYCGVLEVLPDGDGDAASLRGGVGWRSGVVGSTTVPAGRESLVGVTLRTDDPVIVEDRRCDGAVFDAELLASHDVTSGISVPVGSAGEPWGVLGAYSSDQRTFTERDATFLRGVANVIAEAIDRAEKDRRLREREARLERYTEYTDGILDAVDDVFYVVDETGDVQRWNETLNAVTGYTDAEIESMRPLEFIVEEDRERTAEEIEAVFETGSARLEVGLLTKGGERIPYEFVAVGLENPEGTRVLAGIGRDVTERKQRERELAKYETIVETMSDGIYVKGEDGRFTMVNEAYARMTGYDRGDLVGEHASLVVDEAAIEESKKRLTTAGEGKSDVENPVMEAKLQRADGDRVPVEGTFATRRTDDGRQEEIGVVRDITERKRREQERRRVVRALEAAREGISLLDENGEFIYVNDAYAETFRYEPEEMIGEHWDDLGIEADSSRFVDDILPRISAEGQWSGTTTCARSDGTTFLSQHSLTETDDGELICLVRDITEQRERERDLQAVRTQLDVATEAASVGIWTWDIQEDVVTADDYLASTYGMDPEQAAEGAPMDSFYEAIHEEDRDRTRKQLERAVEETGELEAEYRVWDANGDLVWVVARGEVEYDDDGTPVRLDGAISDITELKRRERQLEESERRYRTLAEHFPNGAVGVYDENLRYTLIEGAVLGDTLPEAEQMEGERMSAVFPDDVCRQLAPLYRAAIEDGETDSTTITFDGEHWQIWAAPLRDADGEIFAGLSLAQEITERVERERRLEELIDRLEESNERLEQFAYAASHDLQEPLRMVSSYLRLIESRYADVLDEDGREFIDFAVDGAERMRDMIDGLLAYSRVERGGDPFEPVDLDGVLENVLEDLQVRIAETDAEITAEELPNVTGDRDQLRQLFQNLLENALEYSGDEPPRVHVSARRRAGRDGRWEIAVRDEGIGIDPADADEIFEVFESLHSRGEYDGTGIGLALCERIVERHGGEIRLESEPGEGATFSVTLPADELEP
ncbi:PAS domain S-box protein [Haloterrigena sp. SYSU A121-1]|uniref:histidine kinase n=1 Tax=Haloterrigena gelatinilytica TaxID=2741724 RepID=A0A8J8GNK7_9EURY|nr:PAS domain S-box protein [Haloterrigena gelatinilytica]NUB92493.1 PAS domain S-box protein [Haloterrigena gelatinilytica]